MYEYYLVSTSSLYTIQSNTGRWRLWLDSNSVWQLDIECNCLTEICGETMYTQRWIHESKLKILRKWVPDYKVFSCTET